MKHTKNLENDFVDFMVRIGAVKMDDNGIIFEPKFVKTLISLVHHRHKNDNIQQTIAMLKNDDKIFITAFLEVLQLYADKHKITLHTKYAPQATKAALRLYEIILESTPHYVTHMYK